MFYLASQFNGDLSRWDIRNVTDMRAIFGGATQYNGNIGQWNVSNVRNMSHMFTPASELNQQMWQKCSCGKHAISWGKSGIQ
jgi:surface protein